MQRAMNGRPIMGQDLRDLIDTMFWLKASPEKRASETVRNVLVGAPAAPAEFPEVPGDGFVKIGLDGKWFTDPTVFLTKREGDSYYFRNNQFPMDPAVYLAGDRTFKNFVDSARASFTGGDGIDIVAGDIRVDNTVSRVGHIHDDRYYTETEMDAKLFTKDVKHRFPINADGTYNVVPSYSNATRRITLTPTGTSFDVWIQGTKYTFTGAQVLPQHSNTSGTYFYYLDENGVFQVSTTSFELLKVAPVATVLWNSTKGEARWIHELHTTEMSPLTHQRLHEKGSVIRTGGFVISGYTLDTTSQSAVNFGVAGGFLFDEDIKHTIPSLADGGAYEIWYRTGANGDWTWDSVAAGTNAIPYKYGATYFTVNQIVTGSWSQVEINSGGVATYGNIFVVITPNNGGVPIVCVQGQNIYTDLATASVESWDAMDKGTFPFQESFAIYRLTYKASVAYSGTTGRVQLAKITSVAAGGESGVSGATVHNSLGGRDAADAHPALAITDIAALTNGALLKKISTGVVAATAADLPLHASRHHFDGADPLAGQSISGLKDTDTPRFYSVNAARAAADGVGSGPFIRVMDAWAGPTKQWIMQLGAGGDLAFWHYGSSTWTKRWNFLVDGALRQGTNERITTSGGGRFTDLVITGQTTLATSLTGMLKATAGVVAVAGASDLPAHASRHHSGGADPLDGQSIAGLLVTSGPTFATLNLKPTGTNGDLAFLDPSGSLRHILRWDNTNDRIAFVTRNDDGSARATRLQIPRSSSLPVSIFSGLTITGTTTLDTGLTGMLKATAGVVSIASGADVPAHAGAHQWDGADPIQGQQLLGLRAHETPTFGGIRGGSVIGYLPFLENNGTEIMRLMSTGMLVHQNISLDGDLRIANLTGVLYAQNGTVRIALGSELPSHTHFTSQVTEDTNLWFTYQRARDAITGSHPISVVNGVVSHVDTDGYRHVPANGTSNSGKFLIAGGAPGSYTWGDIAAGSLPVHAFRHHFDGSDPLVGQSIAGLQVTSTPRFAGMTLTGDLIVQQDTLFRSNSSDGNEQTALTFAGGGGSGATRGGSVTVRGNERPSSGGSITLAAGDGIQGIIDFQTAGVSRATLTKAGEFNVSSGALRVGTLTGLLKATSGLVSVASASDLPNHASRHHSGGADALDGQSIAGLLTTSSPTFAALQVKPTGTVGDIGFLNPSGTLRLIARWDDTNDRLAFVTRNDDGSSRATRFHIPRSSSLEVTVTGGFAVTGQTTLQTTLNGMLKATAGVVGIAGASDLPAHASSHHAGGSDQISGQSLAGLRTTDSPEFNGLRLGPLTGMLKADGFGIVGVAGAIDLPAHASRHHWDGDDPISGQSLSGLRTTSNPQFNALTISSLTLGSLNGILSATSGAVSASTRFTYNTNASFVNAPAYSGANGVAALYAGSTYIGVSRTATSAFASIGGKLYLDNLSGANSGVLRTLSDGEVTIAGANDLPGGPYLPLAGEKRVSGWVAFDATVYPTDVVAFSGYDLEQLGITLHTGFSVQGDLQFEIASPTTINNVVSFESKGGFKFRAIRSSDSTTLPVLGNEQVVMLVGDAGPFEWATNSTQEVVYFNGTGTTVVNAGGNLVGFACLGKCMILVGPTSNSSERCSLFIV